MSISVRRASATRGDVDLVAPLFDAYRQFYRQRSDLALAKSFVRERLAREESVIFLAVRRDPLGERAFGFVQLYPSFSSVRACRIWVLNDLYVAAEARNAGVAQALMDAAREHAVETGARRIVLETTADNAPARALYAKLGYIQEAVETFALEVAGRR